MERRSKRVHEREASALDVTATPSLCATSRLEGEKLLGDTLAALCFRLLNAIDAGEDHSVAFLALGHLDLISCR